MAASAASNTTDAGSALVEPRTTSMSRRLAHTSNCATAPARNVSPAANNTERPSSLSAFAIFATLVVLPEPFTPTTKITVGPVATFANDKSLPRNRSFNRSFKISTASLPRLAVPPRNARRTSSTTSRAMRTPMSHATNVLSIRSIKSSSRSLPLRTPRSPPPTAAAVLEMPRRSASSAERNISACLRDLSTNDPAPRSQTPDYVRRQIHAPIQRRRRSPPLAAPFHA